MIKTAQAIPERGMVLLLLLGALATHYLARNLPLDHVPVHSHHTAGPDITSKPT